MPISLTLQGLLVSLLAEHKTLKDRAVIYEIHGTVSAIIYQFALEIVESASFTYRSVENATRNFLRFESNRSRVWRMRCSWLSFCATRYKWTTRQWQFPQAAGTRNQSSDDIPNSESLRRHFLFLFLLDVSLSTFPPWKKQRLQWTNWSKGR